MQTSNKLSRFVSRNPFLPDDSTQLARRMETIVETQVLGLAKRLRSTKAKTVVVNISGGLDSTLALLVIAKAMDAVSLPRANIEALTLPGFGTSERTLHNAKTLIAAVGATGREINITAACRLHLENIQHDGTHDVVYENAQARQRTVIGMDVANQKKGLFIGTGGLSEIALGFSTFNGDHMSMYNVNCGVPKTLAPHLLRHLANEFTDARGIIIDIINTPVSPELLPPSNGQIAQKTEEIIGEYAVHDFILYHFVRHTFSRDKILYLAKIAFGDVYTEQYLVRCIEIFNMRFMNNQFKRNCAPDGPRVGTVSLSYNNWQMPGDL